YPTAERLIFVGLFPKPLPQGRPIACAVETSPGSFAIGPIPDGRYWLFAAALPYFEDLRRHVGPDPGLLLSRCGRPVRVGEGLIRAQRMLELRAPRMTDPPIVAALPFMLAHSLASRSHAHYQALA